jgi:hypothetical protein
MSETQHGAPFNNRFFYRLKLHADIAIVMMDAGKNIFSYKDK